MVPKDLLWVKPFEGWPYDLYKELKLSELIPVVQDLKQSLSLTNCLRHSAFKLMEEGRYPARENCRRTYNFLKAVDAEAVTRLLQRTEWKVYVEFPQELFMTQGRRWANRTERAYYNAIRNLPKDLWVEKRMYDRMDDICESKRFIERGGIVEINDIWTRIC